MEAIEKKEFYPPLVVLLFLIVAMIFSGMLSTGLVMIYSHLKGVDLQVILQNLNEDSPFSDRHFTRMVNLISHFMTFTLPVIVVSIFLYQKEWLAKLWLNKKVPFGKVIIGVILILSAFPIVQFTYWLNQQIPLPEWAIAMENSAEGMVKGLLVMDSFGELLFTLFIVAVLPAVGEELVFRGMVQSQIQAMTKNGHLAVWITAICFSAFHLQFVGFLPRMLLGGILGYLFLWSKNLWIPILAHFAVNSFQVIGQYMLSGELEVFETDALPPTNWLLLGMSLSLVVYLAFLFRQISKKKELEA